MIRSAAFTAKGGAPLFGSGSISMGVRAARKCLDTSKIDPSEVGLLIFCGIYRDENIGEPAIASFIQSKLDVNRLTTGERATFAFDILNSGCGVLTAMHVADSHIRSGLARYALIVASDSVPIKDHTEGFPFAPGGGAVLLEGSDGEKGLVDFKFDTYPTGTEVFRSFIEYRDGTKKGERKGQFLRFEKDPSFLEEGIKGAVKTVKSLLKRNGLASKDIEKAFVSQSPEGFPKGLSKALGIEDKVVDVSAKLGNLHTAGIVASMESSFKAGKELVHGNYLLVNIGSGISVSAALLKA
jgi:3-oxoacyl-[acyl-carrier-protein] synthase-3